MEIKKRDITIDELLVLAKMNKSFSINGFDDNTFLDILCRNGEFYSIFVSKDNLATTFAFRNFVELKDSLTKHLKNIFFDRTTLKVWGNKSE